MRQETAGVAELFEGLRRRWPLALLVAVPLFAGVVYYAETLPDTFESTAIVSLTPRPDIDVGGDVLRVVVPKYVAFLDSRPTLSRVADDIGIAVGELQGGVDVSVAPETANLTISVELASSEAATEAARLLAAEAVQLSVADRLLEADLLVPPVAVTQPSGPPRRLLELGGLFIALLAGVTLALVADRSKPKVSTVDDLADVTGQRILGALPRNRALRQPPLDALADPAVSAAIGAMLVQLDSESRIQAVKVLAVTSPASGDGKTTVAAAVATGLARLDARVLLVDADLRRPRLREQLGVEQGGLGFAEVLEGAPLEKAVAPTASSNLSVLPTRARPDASNLLARKLQAVLATAREQYDVVVLDCPPVLATDDALVITVMCDATLVVVDRGSRTDQVAAATTSLHGLGVRMVGCVLNRAAAGVGGARTYGSYMRR